MKKEIKDKLTALEDALIDAQAELANLRFELDKDNSETVTFQNGRIVINSVEYPISNFTVTWKNNLED